VDDRGPQRERAKRREPAIGTPAPGSPAAPPSSAPISPVPTHVVAIDLDASPIVHSNTSAQMHASVMPPSSAGVRSDDVVVRLGVALRTIANNREPAADAWLDVVSKALAHMCPGAGACAWIAAPSSSRLATATAVGIEAVGCAGVPNRAAVLEAARAGWGIDDVAPTTILAGHTGAHPVVLHRRDAADDARWPGSSLARWRRSVGLHEFVRAGVRFDDADGGRAMWLSLDGLSRDWAACGITALLLREAASAAAEAYVRAFVELRRRRALLLARLSPVQRTLVPMLAAGISERAIARTVGRSAHTIHEHAKTIALAWGARDRYEIRDLWRGLTPRDADAPVRDEDGSGDEAARPE
jgi:DNA-binding CsgD family transcriptional regulator